VLPYFGSFSTTSKTKVLRVELMAYWTPPSKSLSKVVLESYKMSHLMDRSGKTKIKTIKSPSVSPRRKAMNLDVTIWP